MERSHTSSTVYLFKLYNEGYEGKPSIRNKRSKFDVYKTKISDKLNIRRITVRGAYEFMIKNTNMNVIGSYINYTSYVYSLNF